MQPGDVVALKSGGPALTVLDCDGDTAAVVWFDSDDQLQRATLPLSALEHAHLEQTEAQP